MQRSTRAIAVRGWGHATAHDALVELNFSGDHAISVAGRFFTVDAAELRHLQEAGVQPTTWHHHEQSGRIVSIPGNV